MELLLLTMQTTIVKFGLSNSDRKTIQNIINRCPDSQKHQLALFIKKAIENINVNHYIYMGYIIGQIVATEKTLQKIQTNYQPCQRQN